MHVVISDENGRCLLSAKAHSRALLVEHCERIYELLATRAAEGGDVELCLFDFSGVTDIDYSVDFRELLFKMAAAEEITVRAKVAFVLSDAASPFALVVGVMREFGVTAAQFGSVSDAQAWLFEER